MAKRRPRLRSSVVRGLIPNSKILLGVSGGKDSVALLHSTHRLSRLLKIEIAVAHIDHALRDSSANDCEFVRGLAESYKVPFFSVRLVKPGPGINVESWGREERYRFFEETRKQQGYDWIATAHNANDVAETLLMRLLGNRELNSIMLRDDTRSLIRPLLAVGRDQIDEYVDYFGLKFVEDQSNADQSFLRNKVRHTLIPALQVDFDKSIIYSLAERAGQLAEDERFLSDLASEKVRGLSGHTWGSIEWTSGLLKIVSESASTLAWRVIEEAMRSALGFSLGRAKCLTILQFLHDSSSGVDIIGSLRLERNNGTISILKR